MTSPATTSNKTFFIGKSAEWYRFEQTGDDTFEIESYWFDDIRRTETVSLRGARKIWKMLTENGFVDETNERTSARIARESAIDAKPLFGNKLAGSANERTAADDIVAAKLAEQNAATDADLAARGLKKCPKCSGRGTLNGLSRFKCRRCNGTKSVPIAAFERK